MSAVLVKGVVATGQCGAPVLFLFNSVNDLLPGLVFEVASANTNLHNDMYEEVELIYWVVGDRANQKRVVTIGVSQRVAALRT